MTMAFHELPFSDLFAGMAENLEHVADRIQKLESIMQAVVLDGAKLSPDLIRSLQSFDHVGQSIADMTLLLNLLAKLDTGARLPEQNVAEIVAHLRMAQTRDLFTATRCSEIEHKETAPGDTYMF